MAGSVPIADLASAKGLPDPHVSARVTGSAQRRVLHYRYAPVAGTTVTFAERGRDTARVLGTARGRAGVIAFTPGRPSRVRATRRNGTIRVSWRGVPGATRCEVLLELSDGTRDFRVLRGTHTTLPDPFPRLRGTVSVDVRTVDLVCGRAATVALRPVITRRR